MTFNKYLYVPSMSLLEKNHLEVGTSREGTHLNDVIAYYHKH